MPLKAPDRHSCRKSAGLDDFGVTMSASEERDSSAERAGALPARCQAVGAQLMGIVGWGNHVGQGDILLNFS